ncbi:MAG: M48 family metallopeptidase [Candidatus Peribacter sp.]|nr:M48 family metallopeptidase [Candidatus Peribacter sp.]
MKQHPVRHRVERTKNKHSRAVFRDDTIIIRLAKGLTQDEEKEHVDDLLERMLKQVEDEQEKILINPFGKLLDQGESATITLANGKKYCFCLKPGKKTFIRRTTRGWNVTIGPNMRRKGLHRLLWKTLAAEEHSRLEELVHKINNDTYGVNITKVKLQFASSQWGSCSYQGVIMLNSALLFVKPEVMHYVIVHELAHRKRADHSAQYWSWVEWALPNYNKYRESLYDYRLPTI